MSKLQKATQRFATQSDLSIIEVKSKFDAEFRRFPVDKNVTKTYEQFYKQVETMHKLEEIPFTTWYTDIHNDLLPINNDNNFTIALNQALNHAAKPLLRLFVQRKGEGYEKTGLPPEIGQPKKNLQGVLKSMNILPHTAKPESRLSIGTPKDFRRVSAIVDVDILPETQRRVRLLKHNTDKPLGFYIRDGTSVRVTPTGLDRVPGIFVSRLVPGGLAESTGLLAVNDEVLEVNGIDVAGKTLDQVTDMMIANSHNLIITVKPANQMNNVMTPMPGTDRTEFREKSKSMTNLNDIRSPIAIPSGTPTIAHAYTNHMAEDILDSDEEGEPTVDDSGVLSI